MVDAGSIDLPDVLLAGLLEGNVRALSRSISCVENHDANAEAIIRGAYSRSINAWVLGVTGGTGSGKSTLVDALAESYRREGKTVGVVAVDPSSPFSGGALLGDRVRMQRHATDSGVFIRSMASRGAGGGLAASTYDVVTLMAAAAWNQLIIETVGVGQEELDVAGVAHTTCVVLTPAGGDSVQAIKAGIMEIGDVVVLNKSDIAGADRAYAQLRAAVSHAPGSDWVPPLVRTVATEGQGIDDLRVAISEHRDWAEDGGRVDTKRREVAGLRLRSIIAATIWQRAWSCRPEEERVRILNEVATGRTDPYTAAKELIAQVQAGGSK